MKNLWSKVVENVTKVVTVKRALIAGGLIIGLAVIDYVANELKEEVETEGTDNVIDIYAEEVNIDPEG